MPLRASIAIILESMCGLFLKFDERRLFVCSMMGLATGVDRRHGRPAPEMELLFLRSASRVAHQTPANHFRNHNVNSSLMSAVSAFCHVDWLFRRLGDSTLSTITSSICSLERAQRPAKVIPLVLQCLRLTPRTTLRLKHWET